MQTGSHKAIRVRRHRVRLAAQAGEIASTNGTVHLPSVQRIPPESPPEYMARYMLPPPVGNGAGETALPVRPQVPHSHYVPGPPPLPVQPEWPARKGLTETDARMLELAGRPRSGWRVALKNGFYPATGAGWRLGSTGFVRRDGTVVPKQVAA